MKYASHVTSTAGTIAAMLLAINRSPTPAGVASSGSSVRFAFSPITE